MGAISWAGRPVMTAMRVRPWRWIRASSSRTPAQGRAVKRSTRKGASVPS